MMQMKCICLMLLSSVLITAATSSNSALKYKIKPEKYRETWDFLVFTQQWPPVACLGWKILNPSHECNLTDVVKSWTVHGIWPSLDGKKSPSFCNDSLSFNASQIQDIKTELNSHWPNLYANTPEMQLWAHEWNKHGTCAAVLPQLGNEKLFFSQGVNWAKQYDLLSILQEYGIAPSRKTPVLGYDIQKAIETKLKVRPSLLCEYVPVNKTYYIFEIELCFDKTLRLMNCPGSSIKEDWALLGSASCPPGKLLWYPELQYDKTVKKGRPAPSPSFFTRFVNTVLWVLPHTW